MSQVPEHTLRPFIAHEFVAETCEFTGKKEVYLAETSREATLQCLYEKNLSRNAYMGQSKCVVYSGIYGYSVTPE